MRFLTLSHKAKHDWDPDPRWAAFIGQYRDKLRLSMDPQPMTLEKTKRWLEKQVSGSLRMIDLVGAYTGSTFPREIVDHGKLTPKHWDMIKHYRDAKKAEE